MWRFVIGVAVLVAAGVGQGRAGQTDVQSSVPPEARSLYGRDLFAFYCATCHGQDGKGNGAVAPALRTQPSDLTMVAQRNGGTFPTAQLESFVTGDRREPSPTHGTREMPVW